MITLYLRVSYSPISDFRIQSLRKADSNTGIMDLKRIGSKFLVLSWKNLLLKRRHWFMTILELVLPIILFVLIAVLRQVGALSLCFANKKLFSRGQIENNRGQDNGVQDDDNTPFHSSDLNQLINDNDNFCRNWGGGERMIYYTSGQEDKEQLDIV